MVAPKYFTCVVVGTSCNALKNTFLSGVPGVQKQFRFICIEMHPVKLRMLFPCVQYSSELRCAPGYR